MKTIIMYRTALLAENKGIGSMSFAEKADCTNLINSFNDGYHVVDDNNKENSYSVIEE